MKKQRTALIGGTVWQIDSKGNYYREEEFFDSAMNETQWRRIYEKSDAFGDPVSGSPHPRTRDADGNEIENIKNFIFFPAMGNAHLDRMVGRQEW